MMRSLPAARKLLKSSAAMALHATGADRLVARWNGRAELPLVLCYHRVVDAVERERCSAPAMLVSTRTLARQLDWVGRRHRFVGLDELGDRLASGVPFARPVAAVTFDDGYAGVFDHAFPLLRKKGIPFAVFVVTDLVNSRRLQTHDAAFIALSRALAALGPAGLVALLEEGGFLPDRRLATCAVADRPLRLVELAEQMLSGLPHDAVCDLVRHVRTRVTLPVELAGELRSMTWRMLATLRDAGAVVGSHTRRHFVLPNERPEDVAAELAESKRALDAHLGGDVQHVAYPDGQFCPVTLAAARAAGYRYGYTTCFHRAADEPLLTIPRVIFSERSFARPGGGFSGSVAACEIAGVFDRLRPEHCNHAVRGPGAARATLVSEAVR
jgi:peptidoglycan/xylan/chitin deacetylase (PgdA/CDA1 family)